MAGFTSVRNVGASGRFDDMALRKAINEGWTIGPRMETAGHAIGITGGHCDENGFKPGVAQQTTLDGVADGPEQIRQAVRLQIKYGATVIKTCATGGVLSEGDAVGATQYTYEELKALVDEANKLERKVAAHAHGTEGIKLAVRAGVSSIEHGSFLDEEGARMMKERGTYLVPTLSAAEAVERAAKNGVLKGLRAEKALAAAASVRRAIKLAVTSKDDRLGWIRRYIGGGLTSAVVRQHLGNEPARGGRHRDPGGSAARGADQRGGLRRRPTGPSSWRQPPKCAPR